MDFDIDELFGNYPSGHGQHDNGYYGNNAFRFNGSLDYITSDNENASFNDICYMPKSWNCSESYNKRMQMLLDGIWTKAAVVKYAIFGISMISNASTLWVLTQKKYKTKLVPNTLAFLYIANIIYMVFMTFANVGIPFKDTESFNEVAFCRYTSIIAATMRSVTNWILVCVSLIQISTILCPYNFVRFRINPNHSWIILGLVLTIAIVSVAGNITDQELLRICNFQDKKLCIFEISESYFIVNYAAPLFLIVFCSIVIVISSFRSPVISRYSTESQSSRRVNRIILASTCLFAGTTCPLMVFLLMISLGPRRKPCDHYFYHQTIQRTVVMNLSMLNFGLDSFLFTLISPPFRRDILELCSRIYNLFFVCKKKENETHTNNNIRQSMAPKVLTEESKISKITPESASTSVNINAAPEASEDRVKPMFYSHAGNVDHHPIPRRP